MASDDIQKTGREIEAAKRKLAGKPTLNDQLKGLGKKGKK